MLSFDTGRPIAKIETGKYKDQIIYIDDKDDATGPKYSKIDLRKNRLEPILDPDFRNVSYIAGPAGSGKSTYLSILAKTFKKLNPKKDIYFFSRKHWKDDPALKHIKPIQVPLDQSMITNPIVLEDIDPGSLCMFDDITTLNNKKVRDAVFSLVEDIMEVGRAKKIDIILTNHLINPNDRKFGRTVLNEMQTLTVFGRSGSAYQIRYVLNKYFGLDKNQINRIMKLPSRWITIFKSFPITVMHEHGAYIMQ